MSCIEIYDSLYVADFIICFCDEENLSMSNLKLQKVLYLLQNYFLFYEDRPLFDDDFEAWGFGAVVPKVYLQYKCFGGRSIISVNKKVQDFKKISENDKKIIIGIVKSLNKYNNVTLTEFIIKTKAFKCNYERFYKKIIPKNCIKKHKIINEITN